MPRRLTQATGALDQAFSSASNILMVLAVARTTTPQAFGTFAFAYVGLTVLMALVRGGFGTPISLSARDPRAVTAQTRWALRRIGLATTVVAIAGVLLVLLAGTPAMVAAGALVSLAPVVLLQDLLRFEALAQGRDWTAVTADGAWAAVSGGLLISTWALGSWAPSAVIVLMWGLGGMVSLGILVSRAHPSFSRDAGSLRVPEHPVTLGDRLRLAVDASMGGMVALALTAGVGLVLDAASVAALRGASTLLGPVNVLISSLQIAVVPAMVRQAHATNRQLLRIAAPVSGAVALCAGGVSLAGLLLPSHIGELALGSTWVLAAPIVAILGVEYVGQAMLTALLTILRARNQTRTLLRIRLLMGAAQTSFGLLAAIVAGTAVAVAVSSAILAWMAAILILVRVVMRPLPQQHGPTP